MLSPPLGKSPAIRQNVRLPPRYVGEMSKVPIPYPHRQSRCVRGIGVPSLDVFKPVNTDYDGPIGRSEPPLRVLLTGATLLYCSLFHESMPVNGSPVSSGGDQPCRIAVACCSVIGQPSTNNRMANGRSVLATWRIQFSSPCVFGVRSIVSITMSPPECTVRAAHPPLSRG